MAVRFRDRNRHRDAILPVGYTPCGEPTCNALVDDDAIDYEAMTATCPRGHVTDLDEWARRFESPGGWTHAGLTCTQQGELGELVVQNLGDLGEYGRIDMWESTYMCPLDGRTDKGWGVEVKSVNATARNHCFIVGRRSYREKKIAYMREKGYAGIVGALVVLDYRTSWASIWLRGWADGIRYFERKGDPFARRRFANPFASARAA